MPVTVISSQDMYQDVHTLVILGFIIVALMVIDLVRRLIMPSKW